MLGGVVLGFKGCEYKTIKHEQIIIFTFDVRKIKAFLDKIIHLKLCK